MNNKRRITIFPKQAPRLTGFLLLVTFAVMLAGCENTVPKAQPEKDTVKKPTASAAPADTTPKVTGIGGIFFYSDNVKEAKAWYAKNLGIEMNDWGSASFESRDKNNPDVVNSLQWKPFKKGDDYFAPSKKEFMINYQVQNLEGLLVKLKANGVTILDTMATYDYGKFIHIMDAEGNKIELWEPKN